MSQKPILAPDESAYAQRLAGSALYFALVETWRVIDAAGLNNLMNGVQLGPVAWHIKMQNAHDMSMRAIAKAEGSE